MSLRVVPLIYFMFKLEVVFLMKILLCSRPRSFRLYLCSRWKPRSHQCLVSRILRQWLMSFSSFWNCLSQGQWRHSSPHSLGDNWVWQWASTRTSSRWSALTCWARLWRVGLRSQSVSEQDRCRDTSSLEMVTVKENRPMWLPTGVLRSRWLINLYI